ncbi:MAG TPA: hypothetical protein VKC15_17810 [Gemmatimonadales bacterium]|nr:hypothetical protein [Gemmatimonadales bacterium]
MDDAPRPSTGRLHPVKVYGKGGGSSSSPSAPKKASPLLNGILVGIVAAVGWAVIVYVTGYEIGWVAWGVGALVGLAVAKSAHEPSAVLGPTAAALAVGSLLLAKVLIVQFGAPSLIRNEVLKNPDAVTAMFMVDMRVHKSFSPELQASLDQVEKNPGALAADRRYELIQQVQAEAAARAKAASQRERTAVVGASVDGILKAMGFFGLLKSVFSFWDVLWIFLAVSSAFKIAQSGSA